MTATRTTLFSLLLSFALIARPASAEAKDEQDSLLLHNVHVIDVAGDQLGISPGVSILIEDGTITRIMPSNEASATTAAEVVEGGGRFVMAGLVDMHVHVWDEASLGAYLAAGVTTIRNASGMPFHLRLAEQIERGETVGPRLITTGPILNSPGANAQINHQIITTADEARAAVQQQHAAGYRRLKVYSNLTREAYEALLPEARGLGMTVMGHTPEGVRAAGTPYERPFTIAFEEILDDNFVTIEHVESIVWHGLRDRHDEASGRALAKKIAGAKVPVTPTLLAFYNLLRVAETQGAYLKRPGTERLNPILVAQSQSDYDRWASEEVGRNRMAFEFYKRMVRIMSEEGVLLVAGSDAGIFTNVPGISLIEELELLEEAGLEAGHILRAATLNPAIALGEAGTAGRVAPGHRADLVVLDRNPLADLEALKSPAAVIAHGTVLDSDALDKLRQDAAEHDLARTQQNIVEAFTAQGVDPAVLGL